ncbi:ACSL1-like protein [Mya arenaria]|uniref:long-chain-fatty-acid--CoA ligase n=1 Tax=Mya arenaria TaxID=6604 RepID=A0ABY7E7T2_MYAAR|nr:ACSL1-like protein [Mya arenaria]
MDVLGDSVGMMCASAGALTAIAGAAAVYYMSKMPDPTCSKLMPKGELLDYKPHKDVCTLLDVFKQGVKTAADSPFLGTRSGPNREYEWITYQESYDQARWFGSWLLDQGLESGKDNNIIGVFAQNRQEWIISDLGCRCYNLLVVALYETLGHDAIIFVINQTQMPLLVCDSAEKVNKILSLVEEAGIKHVKTLVVMDNNADVNSALATKLGINIVTFQDALEKGKANLKPEAVMEGYGQTEAVAGVTFHVPGELYKDPMLALCTACWPINFKEKWQNDMYEAFGQTEAVAAVTMTIPCETLSGMVGPPMPQNFVKLVDSQEQGYFAANNQGEVLVKGGNVASGYYKEPEKTAETFDKDGWLHTGDIGEWLPGEYIAPEKIETVYCRSKFVAQVFVEGNSLQPFAVAIVVPDEEVLLQWACNNGVTGKFQDLCESQKIELLKNVILQKNC